MRLLLALFLGAAAASEALYSRLDEALLAADRQAALLLGEQIAAGDSGPRMVLARAEVAVLLGRFGEAEALLGWQGRAFETSPDPLRLGRAWQVVARCRLAAGDGGIAAEAAGQALAAGGAGVQADECMLIVAEGCAKSGNTVLARRAAQRLWQGWRGSPHRPAAGLLLARLILLGGPGAIDRTAPVPPAETPVAMASPDERDRAAALLTVLLAEPSLTSAQRREAALLGLGAAWPERPREAAAILDAVRRDPALAGDRLLQRWQILFLSRSDPAAAAAALASTDLVLASDQALAAVVADAARIGVAGDRRVLLAAQELLRVGRDAEALAMLEQPARQVPEAALLALAAGLPPARALDLPTASDPAVAVAIADAAWRLRDTLLTERALALAAEPADAHLRSRRWYLLAQGADASVAPAWWDRLRKEGTGVEAGMAWAEAARGAAGKVAQDAWERALELLPDGEPLAGEGAQVLVRDFLLPLQPGVRGTGDAAWRERLDRASDRLAATLAAGVVQPDPPARHLLLLALAQLGRVAEAEAVLAQLRTMADTAERRARLDLIAARLRTGGTSGTR